MSDFSVRFHNLRIEYGYTFDALTAEINRRYGTNFTKSTFSKWENDKADPSFQSIPYIANFFNVSVDYLIGVSDDRNPKAETTAPMSEDERYVIKFRNALNSMDDDKKKLMKDNIDTMYKMLGIDPTNL